jgi:plasmid stabilization system protein ParE
VPTDNRHKAWLTFVRRAMDVPLDYTVADLHQFRRLALHESPSLVRLIEGYIDLAVNAETSAQSERVISGSSGRKRSPPMHLFDLLREKTFFPRNSDLAQFAARVVPGMRTYSFDKMARSDIAARIVEYVEDNSATARGALEKSMRDALSSMKREPEKKVDRRSFLSKWERIIKGLEL